MPNATEVTTLPTLSDLQRAYEARGGKDADVYAVGRSGSSYAGRTGDKLHVIISTHSFRPYGACGARNDGRSRVAILPGYDTDTVSCSKCLSWLRSTAGR